MPKIPGAPRGWSGWLLGLLALALAGCGGHPPGSVRNLARAQVDYETRAEEVIRGALAYGIDDCGGLRYDLAYSDARVLTTPIAYLAAVPRDPYSSEGRLLEVLAHPDLGNGSPYGIVSVGPDGQSELLLTAPKVDMTSRTSVRQFVKSQPDLMAVSFDQGWISTTQTEIEYATGPTTLRYRDGRVVPVGPNLRPGLPKLGWDEANDAPKVYHRLLTSGMILYDPTNGTRSRGDLVIVGTYGGRFPPMENSKSNP